MGTGMTKLERDECVFSSVQLCLQSVPHMTDTAPGVSAASRGHRGGWVAEGGGNVTTKLQDTKRNLLLAVVVLFPVIHALDTRLGPSLCVSFLLHSLVYWTLNTKDFLRVCVCVGNSLDALVT